MLAAYETAFGCTLTDTRARLDVGRTLDAFGRSCDRIASVSGEGGRVIFATTRPASLLALHGALAGHARRSGARVLSIEREGPVRARRRPDRSLFWIDGVAVLSDGNDLLAHDEPHVWRDLDSAVGRAELVVTDGVLAGATVTAGFDVVAFADLSAVAVAVAAGRAGRR